MTIVVHAIAERLALVYSYFTASKNVSLSDYFQTIEAFLAVVQTGKTML